MAFELLPVDFGEDADGAAEEVARDRAMIGSGEADMEVDRRRPLDLRDGTVQRYHLVRRFDLTRLVLLSIPVSYLARPEHADPTHHHARAQFFRSGKIGERSKEVLAVIQSEHPAGAVADRLHDLPRARAAMEIVLGRGSLGRMVYVPGDLGGQMSDLLVPDTEAADPEEIVLQLRRGGRALVALSGGVDSAVVAALATAALGPAATAATVTGPAVSEAEVGRARTIAEMLGLTHVLLPADPLKVEEYRSNPANRCYFCRTVEAGMMTTWGRDHGVRQFVDGLHLDDLGDARPGIRAMEEAGFHHPLLEARWTKLVVRSYARRRGLPNWDLPSEACLASRVPHGRPITEELLRRIEAAESQVRALGFRRVRVRVEGSGARVLVDPQEVERLHTDGTAKSVQQSLGVLGFAPVALDRQGYRHRPNG